MGVGVLAVDISSGFSEDTDSASEYPGGGPEIRDTVLIKLCW